MGRHGEGSDAPGVWTRPPGILYTPRHVAATAPRQAQVAQLVEHATENRSVGGSIPPLGTILSLAVLR